MPLKGSVVGPGKKSSCILLMIKIKQDLVFTILPQFQRVLVSEVHAGFISSSIFGGDTKQGWTRVVASGSASSPTVLIPTTSGFPMYDILWLQQVRWLYQVVWLHKVLWLSKVLWLYQVLWLSIRCFGSIKCFGSKVLCTWVRWGLKTLGFSGFWFRTDMS